MPTLRRRFLALLSLASLLVVAGCDGLAQALTDPTATTATATTGTITIWTSDPSPSSIAVSLDGAQVGVLTAYRSAPPSCGAASSSGTVTVTVAPGTHSMQARETSASGRWGPSSLTVNAGGCITYELTP